MLKTSTEQRITCNIIGPRNNYGKDKLIATIDQTGLHVWCRYCRQPHLIAREVCMDVWKRGEGVIMCREQVL
jgi:hypothetical protein